MRCFPAQPSILHRRTMTLTWHRLFAIRPNSDEPERSLKDRLKEAPGSGFSNLCSILDTRPQEYSSSMVLAAAVQIVIACMEPDATKRYCVPFHGRLQHASYFLSSFLVASLATILPCLFHSYPHHPS